MVLDPLLKKTKFCFHGGEALLYPEIEELLDFMRGRRYSLLTNGILDIKLIELVNRYQVPEIGLSLDGRPETNKLIRGIESFEKTLNLIRQLKKKTKFKIFYTISQYNNLDDYNFVKKLAQDYQIGFNICVLGNPPFFNVNHNIKQLNIDQVIIKQEPFAAAFLKWRNGQLNPGCHSIFIYTVIWPDGRVSLCQQKYDLVLGNVREQEFNFIWNHPRTIAIQKKYAYCNDCWLSCQRPIDLIYLKS